MLTDRQLQILGLIIQRYAKEETPIGSKKLMQEGVKASSATIRNDMSSLEAMGLLQKNHISSGRIPSLLGYQYYVEYLLQTAQPDFGEIELIRSTLRADFATIAELLERTVGLLAELTNFTVFAIGVDGDNQRLTDFKIIQLNKRQTLVVMITDLGNFENKVVILPSSIASIDLDVLETMVKERLVGEQLSVIYSRLRTEFPIVLQRHFSNSYSVLNFLENIWQDVFADEMYMSGQLNLLNNGVIENGYDFQDLYAFFENQNNIINLIQQINDEQNENLGVHIGLGLENEIFSNLSMLTTSFDFGDKGSGTLAILGPINMAYSEILGLLDVFSDELTKYLTEYSRYLDSTNKRK